MTTTQVPFQGKDVLLRLLVPKQETFNGDGIEDTFTLANTPLGDGNRDGTVDTSDVTATVDGVAAALTSIDANTGEVVFTTPPASGTGNVVIDYHYEHEPIMAEEVSISEEVENIELDQLGTDEKLIAETSLSVEGDITLRKEDSDMVQLFWGGTSFAADRTKFILKIQEVRGTTTYTYYYHECKLWTREQTHNAGDVSEEVYGFTAAGGKVLQS